MKRAPDGRLILELAIRNDPRWPAGVAPKVMPAPYSQAEMAYMRRLRPLLDSEDPEVAAQALNEMSTLHELKALLDAELVDDDAEPDEVDHPSLLDA